jgi:predicted nuclease with TOPRIM domain
MDADVVNDGKEEQAIIMDNIEGLRSKLAEACKEIDRLHLELSNHMQQAISSREAAIANLARKLEQTEAELKDAQFLNQTNLERFEIAKKALEFYSDRGTYAGQAVGYEWSSDIDCDRGAKAEAALKKLSA